MIEVDNSQKIPIKKWVKTLEETALNQAYNLANLPFAFKWIALMADAHSGYGMPIGGVLATKDVIIPNAVGVDIGCGMCALQLPLQWFDIDSGLLRQVREEIHRRIPVGFNHHKNPLPDELMPKNFTGRKIISEQYQSARCQLGTLGRGNHFIEIQKGSDGYLWVMIHSGSRNLGYQVARYYNSLAKELNKKWHTKVSEENDLAFLPVDSPEGQAYLSEMQYCVDFALRNRRYMIEEILSIIKKVYFGTRKLHEYTLDTMINIAHNYAILEHHFGENVWVHRKGATLARKDTIGIIPGSQGTSSYIVKGKGNPNSFHSCSHGAGRVMSRTAARANLSFKEEVKKMEDKQILHSIRNKADLDEASGAYKDIEEVMDNQKDLVDILIKLEPLVSIKAPSKERKKKNKGE